MKKAAALILVLILIVNLVVYAMGLINDLIFWAIIIAIAFIAYFGFSKSKIYKGKKQ
ncbi:hypothetical protein ACFL96_08570 [Thermoproteota archaeon]